MNFSKNTPFEINEEGEVNDPLVLKTENDEAESMLVELVEQQVKVNEIPKAKSRTRRSKRIKSSSSTRVMHDQLRKSDQISKQLEEKDSNWSIEKDTHSVRELVGVFFRRYNLSSAFSS